MDSIRDFCRGQIAHLEVPCYVKFGPVPDDRHRQDPKYRMREIMREEMKLSEEASA